MESQLHQLAIYLATGVELLSLVGIALGLLVSLVMAARARRRRGSWEGIFGELRRNVGRTLLLGLDYLLAAEIARSVLVGEALGSVMTLGLLAVVRVFLSTTIEMEISGRWPGQMDEGGSSVG